MPSAVLSPEQFLRIARAIADPTRYEMLRRIYTECNQSCSCVANHLSISPGTVSHHLRELESADLIRVIKNGRYRMLAPRRDIWKAYIAQLRQL